MTQLVVFIIVAGIVAILYTEIDKENRPFSPPKKKPNVEEKK